VARWSATRHRVCQSNSDSCRKSLLYYKKRAASNGLWPEAVQTVYSRSQDGRPFRPRLSDVLETSKRASGHQARWLDFIEQVTLDLQHCKGASHNNADALSRRPCERQGEPFRQCSGRSVDREDSAATREGIPTENQSSEGPEVPRNVPPEPAASRTVTTRARDRQQRRQAATEDRAEVDDTTATVPPASGRQRPSGVHRDHRDGYRPTGACRAPPEASKVDLDHSEQIDVRPDRTGSGRIRPARAGSSQTDCEPAEVEPAYRHGVPDDCGYSSVGKLQPTWTRERLAELQKADPDVAIMREWYGG